jgi:hypothetical protein
VLILIRMNRMLKIEVLNLESGFSFYLVLFNK